MQRPLYSQLVKYYELIEGRNWEGEVALVSSVLKKYACRSVVDLGCGTGRHVRELARLGYDAVGIDISSYNIRFARRKASQDRLAAKFIVGSYYNHRSAGGYDAAICLNWSIPVKDGEMRRFLHNTSSLLHQGGVLMLDYEKASEIVWDDIGKPTMECWRQGGETITRVSVGRIVSNVMRSDDVYLIFPEQVMNPPNEKSRYRITRRKKTPQVYVDRSFVRFFSPTELDHFAKEAGFNAIEELVLPRNKYNRTYAAFAKAA